MLAGFLLLVRVTFSRCCRRRLHVRKGTIWRIFIIRIHLLLAYLKFAEINLFFISIINIVCEPYYVSSYSYFSYYVISFNRRYIRIMLLFGMTHISCRAVTLNHNYRVLRNHSVYYHVILMKLLTDTIMLFGRSMLPPDL